MKAPARPGLLRQIREDVAAVRARDPAARGALEVLAVYPGLHAVLAHRLSHRLWVAGWRFGARFIAFLSRMVTGIDIHPGAVIGSRLFIDHGAGVVIGETAEIGDDVTLYQGVTLGGVSLSKSKRHPTLGNGVLVGAGAKVLGAFTVGANARIGANSVVIAEVPEAATVVGVPGRIVAASQRRPGIDLDHHLIPDPVGKAIQCLIDRIDVLEHRLALAEGADKAAGLACGEAACDAQCIDTGRALPPVVVPPSPLPMEYSR